MINRKEKINPKLLGKEGEKRGAGRRIYSPADVRTVPGTCSVAHFPRPTTCAAARLP